MEYIESSIELIVNIRNTLSTPEQLFVLCGFLSSASVMFLVIHLTVMFCIKQTDYGIRMISYLDSMNNKTLETKKIINH